MANQSLAQTGNFLWSRGSGGTGSDEAFGVAVDGNANCYVGGWFQGTATFDGTNLVSQGGRDAFLVKYDSAGRLQWAARGGGTNDDGIFCVATDLDGNCLVTGFFAGSASFGTNTLNGGGSTHCFVAKYGTNGTIQWIKQSSGTGDGGGIGMAATGNGDCFVAGAFSGTVTLGTTNLTSAGSDDIFLAKYNALGAFQWAKQAGGPNADRGYGVALDRSGNIYLKGFFTTNASFGATNLSSTSPSSIFLGKYDSVGSLQWIRQADGQDLERGGLDIALDDTGNCYVVGQFRGTAFFGSTNIASGGTSDNVFVAKYATNGDLLWVKTAGGAGSWAYAHGVTTDGFGNCYVTGGFTGTAVFDSTNLVSTGADDIFSAKYFPDGWLAWVAKAGGATGEDWGNRVAATRNGSCYVVGAFNGTASFGTNTLVAAGGSEDVFVFRQGIPMISVGCTLSNRSALLSVTGDNGINARLDWVTNVTDWTTPNHLATNLVPYSVIDSASSNAQQRFYRAVLLP